jgi:hypothetical protein
MVYPTRRLQIERECVRVGIGGRVNRLVLETKAFEAFGPATAPVSVERRCPLE